MFKFGESLLMVRKGRIVKPRKHDIWFADKIISLLLICPTIRTDRESSCLGGDFHGVSRAHDQSRDQRKQSSVAVFSSYYTVTLLWLWGGLSDSEKPQYIPTRLSALLNVLAWLQDNIGSHPKQPANNKVSAVQLLFC